MTEAIYSSAGTAPLNENLGHDSIKNKETQENLVFFLAGKKRNFMSVTLSEKGMRRWLTDEDIVSLPSAAQQARRRRIVVFGLREVHVSDFSMEGGRKKNADLLTEGASRGQIWKRLKFDIPRWLPKPSLIYPV